MPVRASMCGAGLWVQGVVRGCGEASTCRDVILEDCRMLLLGVAYWN